MTFSIPETPRARRSPSLQPTHTRRALLRGAAASTLALTGAAGTRRAHAQTTAVTSALDDLRQRLRGTLLDPDDPSFLNMNAPANRYYQDVLPTAIARCAGEADVIACVAWCREHGVTPVVRGGGHSYAGLSTTTGLLIDLRDVNHVSVDHAAGTMTVGGAAANADLFNALKDGPLFLPGGVCPTVCIGGLTLGGGIGYNTRWAGLTCDHLQHTHVVAASAEPLDVTPSQHGDLFWAMQGGAGGSFGVNTAFTFNLVEVPVTPVTNFSVAWRGADAAGQVIRSFQDLLYTAPPEFGATVAVIPTDPGASGPKRAIEVSLTGQFVGSKRLPGPHRTATVPEDPTHRPIHPGNVLPGVPAPAH